MEGMLLYFVVGGLVTSVAAYCGWAGMWSRSRAIRRVRRLLKSCAELPVEQLQEGIALACGTVVPRQTLTAPLSGEQVIGYRLKAEQFSDVDYGYQRWKPLLDITRMGDFELADGTGRALVRVEHARLLLLLADNDQLLTEKISPGTLKTRLGACGIELQEEPPDEGAVYLTEYHLAPDTRACALGPATRRLDPGQESQNYREAPTRLVVEPLFVGNLPREQCQGMLDRCVLIDKMEGRP